MMLGKITRIVYGLFGAIFVLLGTAALLTPTGWLPQGLSEITVAGEIPGPFGHILQEYGAAFLALGFVFFWFAKYKKQSLGFHWAMTFYFALNALIHWFKPEGSTGSWLSGLMNSIPFMLLLLLGLLQQQSSERESGPGVA